MCHIPFILFFLLAGLLPASASDLQEARKEARGIVRAYAGELKGELKGALRSGGAVRALEVCRGKAPGIAGRLSAETGWKVGRTSLRVRNPANAPDAWERERLQEFTERRRQGEQPSELEVLQVVAGENGKIIRYMKAIPTGELCLTCHGTDLDPALRERLRQLYPEDRATGFREGEIRGAFSLSVPAEKLQSTP